MYKRHRKNFGRDAPRGPDAERFGEDPWLDENRGWRTPYRGGRHEGEEGPWNVPGRRGAGRREDFGHDEPHPATRNSRPADAHEDPGYVHDPEHHHYGQGAASYGYGAGQPYREGDSRYFTGQQNSWVVRSPYGGGGRGYGADYREHSYAGRHHEHDRGFWDRAGDEVASWFGNEAAAERRARDHRGRGPKGYVRSDERINEDANDRLTEDSHIDASNVTVSVAAGEVTLDGTVASREEKRRAEDVVETISGVKHVQNNLRIEEHVSGAYEANWTQNSRSTAEGGVNGAGDPRDTRL